MEWGVYGGSILGGTNGGRGQEVCGSARPIRVPRRVQTPDDAAFPARGNVAHREPFTILTRRKEEITGGCPENASSAQAWPS